MSKKTTGTSVSLTKRVLAAARLRARDTERGNFSAYVERLIQADVAKANARLRLAPTPPIEVAA